MLSQGAFLQKAEHMYGMKVLENTGLHLDTRSTAVITENDFLLMSKQRSQRDPIMSFLKSVPGFKSTISPHNKMWWALSGLQNCLFPVFQIAPQPLPSQKTFSEYIIKTGFFPKFCLITFIFPPGSCCKSATTWLWIGWVACLHCELSPVSIKY